MNVALELDYAIISCWSCGIQYAVPGHFDRTRRVDGAGFYCPNGHSAAYHETTVQKLEKQLARKQELLDAERRDNEHQKQMRAQLNKRLSATKGIVTRIRNRVGNGVCPCCNRSFVNLRRHMDTKHPAWKSATGGGER